MKKLLPFILAIAYCLPALSQTDSLLFASSYRHNIGSPYYRIDSSRYFYNNNSMPDSIYYYQKEANQSSYTPLFKTLFEYRRDTVIKTWVNWYTDDSKWENNRREMVYLDQSTNVQYFFHWTWESGFEQWENKAREITYRDQYGRDTFVLNDVWVGILQNWVPNRRWTYIYDPRFPADPDKRIRSLEEENRLVGTNWFVNNDRQIEYDSLGREIFNQLSIRDSIVVTRLSKQYINGGKQVVSVGESLDIFSPNPQPISKTDSQITFYSDPKLATDIGAYDSTFKFHWEESLKNGEGGWQAKKRIFQRFSGDSIIKRDFFYTSLGTWLANSQRTTIMQAGTENMLEDWFASWNSDSMTYFPYRQDLFTYNQLGLQTHFYRYEIDKEVKVLKEMQRNYYSLPLVLSSEQEVMDPFVLFPNPFFETLYLKMDEVQQTSKLRIFSLNGQMIIETMLPAGKAMHQLSFGQGVPPGNYILQLEIANKLYTRKLVKQ
ncbi:MAG: T9SS type A sorting domain-containing protein [Bacteroidia bacterium]|nr:T9SS type A sorting domain-containing protein [Bacteroidia bacterium]